MQQLNYCEASTAQILTKCMHYTKTSSEKKW